MTQKGAYHFLAEPGRLIAVRVTPKASRAAVLPGGTEGADLRITVTVVPEDGKANAAVLKALALALGLPKSRLALVRGAAARDKVFKVL